MKDYFSKCQQLNLYGGLKPSFFYFNFRLARQLLRKGAKADSLVRDGISPLHLIAGHETEEAGRVLEYCAQHANPNVKSAEGLTPVHVAALWGRLQNLKCLITNGGDINQTDVEGNSALDFACTSGEDNATACIKFLLEVESSNPDLDLHMVDHEPASESDFTESFYTAIGEGNDSVLDQTVVTFPKLHPWNVKICSSDLDITVNDGFNNLSLVNQR